MNQPLVSVVVPIYNVEEYLDRCITSVVNQTYSNLEIILIDDGSPDRCPAMCDEWAGKDARIKVIHKKNAGLGMARNSGIDAACGKYIFFFDSDDYVDLTTVERCVNSAEEHHSDVVIYGRWDAFADGRTEKRPMFVKQCLFQGEEVRNELLPKLFTYEMGFGVSACGKMFRLQTIARNGLRFASEREIISEDAFFALEFFPLASVATIVPENLYFYFKRSDSLTNVYLRDRQEKNNAFIERSLAYAEQKGLPEQVATHLTARYHFYTIAAMKQVMASKLCEPEKRADLWKIFRSPVLRRTLTMDVLKIEKPNQKIFFSFLKMRCFWLCFWMLKYKMRT